jgi:flagellar biosynthesis/type III secretory pathway protein FliH
MGTIEQSGHGAIESFEYPHTPCDAVIAGWSGYAEVENAETSGHGRSLAGGATKLSVEVESHIAEETRRSFQAGRERGLQEGRQAEREVHAEAQSVAADHLVRQSAELIASFAQERDRYLRSVEHEVVKLALAIAARILRREAQMDPLLLTGAVRVALGQLSETTVVRLCVPQAELELWTDAIALLPNLALKPILVAGEGMRLGDCVIETSLGSVDLGIRSQLSEIERGFFDQAGKGSVANKLSAVAAGSGELHS